MTKTTDRPSSTTSTPSRKRLSGRFGRMKALRERRLTARHQRAARRRQRKALEGKGLPVSEELARQTPITIENSKPQNETIVEDADPDVLDEDAVDEFSDYFAGKITPKIMITTTRHPSAKLHEFLMEFMLIIPSVYYYKRGPNTIKALQKFAINNQFTDLLIFSEKDRKPNGIHIIHLPEGPTSFFKLTSLKLARNMKGSANASDHLPEIILNNFDTRLGHRLGRQIASLFPQMPEFQGRRVITFHNQRDFIFFRHHRYIFNDAGERCDLHEIGPRFTLKLQWIQQGAFDTANEKYEYIWRPDLQVDRRAFFIG